MTTEESAAHAEITQLVARFTDAANRGDFELARSVWTDDATWEFKAPMQMIAHGSDAIVDSLRKLLEPREFFVHLVHDGVIKVNGETAEARWYIQEMARNKDGKTFYQNIGLYEDRMVKQNGKWLFASRTYFYIWLSQEPFGGQGFAVDPSVKAHMLSA